MGAEGSLPSAASIPLASAVSSMPPASAPRMSTTGLAHGEQIAAAEAALEGGGGSKAIWAVAVVVIAAGVGGLAFLTGDSPPPPAASAPKTVEAKPKPAAAPEPAEPAAPAPAPKPAPLVRSVATTPPGATVIAGDEELGKTPLDVELAEGQAERSLTLKLEGHDDLTVSLDRSTTDPLTSELKAQPAKPTAKKGRKKSGKKASGKKKKRRKKRSGFGLDDF